MEGKENRGKRGKVGNGESDMVLRCREIKGKKRNYGVKKGNYEANKGKGENMERKREKRKICSGLWYGVKVAWEKRENRKICSDESYMVLRWLGEKREKGKLGNGESYVGKNKVTRERKL